MGGAALMQMKGSEMKMEKLRRFVEVTKLLGNDERSNVLAFLDQGTDEQDSSNTQTQASGEILGILKNMKDSMEKDLADLQATEKRIGGLALQLSEDGHALEDATEEKANAEKFLANMKEQCATVEKDKATRMKMRADEIAAVSEAVGILNDDDALEVFAKSKASAALVQKPKTFDALLQLVSQKGVKVKATHRHRMLLLSVMSSHKE